MGVSAEHPSIWLRALALVGQEGGAGMSCQRRANPGGNTGQFGEVTVHAELRRGAGSPRVVGGTAGTAIRGGGGGKTGRAEGDRSLLWGQRDMQDGKGSGDLLFFLFFFFFSFLFFFSFFFWLRKSCKLGGGEGADTNAANQGGSADGDDGGWMRGWKDGGRGRGEGGGRGNGRTGWGESGRREGNRRMGGEGAGGGGRGSRKRGMGRRGRMGSGAKLYSPWHVMRGGGGGQRTASGLWASSEAVGRAGAVQTRGGGQRGSRAWERCEGAPRVWWLLGRAGWRQRACGGAVSRSYMQAAAGCIARFLGRRARSGRWGGGSAGRSVCDEVITRARAVLPAGAMSQSPGPPATRPPPPPPHPAPLSPRSTRRDG